MSSLSASAPPLRVFVGTYTENGSRGIYTTTFNSAKGTFTPPVLAAETPNPSFLDLSPDQTVLYAVNESPAGVRAYTIGAGGALSPLGKAPSGLVGPCDVAAHSGGRLVVVADYSGGSVAAFPVLAGGALGERSDLEQHTGKSVNPQRQEAPHAHGVTYSPDGRFLAVPDLGIDQVKVYAVETATATLRPVGALAIAAGSGPRHCAFSREGRQLYIINELFSTITVASFDPASGALQAIQTLSTLPAGYSGTSTTAEIVVHPSNRFVYGSNRGHDSIAVFSRDPKSGALTWVEATPIGGKTPRNFAVSPDGAWLISANQDSDTLTVFSIHPSTGKLTPNGPATALPRPVCVKFVVAR
ncbi:MAG: lactonase family protein [Opitutaceae bacterium]